MAAADWKFAHDGGRATPQYIKSVDQPHGALTLGFVAQTADKLEKAFDALSGITAALASIETRLDGLDQKESRK